jgi:hypothetical protein
MMLHNICWYSAINNLRINQYEFWVEVHNPQWQMWGGVAVGSVPHCSVMVSGGQCPFQLSFVQNNSSLHGAEFLLRNLQSPCQSRSAQPFMEPEGWRWRQHGPWNVGNLPQHYTTSQTRRSPLESSSPWKPEILQHGNRYSFVWHLDKWRDIVIIIMIMMMMTMIIIITIIIIAGKNSAKPFWQLARAR